MNRVNNKRRRRDGDSSTDFDEESKPNKRMKLDSDLPLLLALNCSVEDFIVLAGHKKVCVLNLLVNEGKQTKLADYVYR